MVVDDSPDEWIATDHDRVFYRSEGDEWNSGEYALAKFVVEHVPDWTVVITVGPYRGHDIHYELHPDERLIHLDFYSPGLTAFGSEIRHRPQHPVVEHAESLLQDIVQGINDSDADFEGVGS